MSVPAVAKSDTPRRIVSVVGQEPILSYLTVAQFECASTLSRATIYRLMAAGAIESRTIGRRRLIPASALEALGAA